MIVSPKSDDFPISFLHLSFAVNRSDTSTKQPTTNSGLESKDQPSLSLADPDPDLPSFLFFSTSLSCDQCQQATLLSSAIAYVECKVTRFLPVSLLSTLSSTHSTFSTVSSGTPWPFPRRLPRASSFHIIAIIRF
ncbi:hypothetical protein IAS59_002497 [Cryptococcus gattii]